VDYMIMVHIIGCSMVLISRVFFLFWVTRGGLFQRRCVVCVP
jgi:hypothetical protein